MFAWIQTAFSHPAALIALIVKLTAITLLAPVFSRRLPDRLTAWLHTWLAVQIVQIIVIIGLSLFGALSRPATWACLLLLLDIGIAGYLWRGARFRRPSVRLTALTVVLAIPLVLWALRCMVMFDFSLDAQTYGSVRIGVWMNYGSVFVHMPTLMVNLFASEWNGEVNALMYAFSAGNIQGALMGNAEILIVATLASMWAARRFGAGQVGSAMVGLLMATSPAFIGLGAVTKGDLLSCVGVIMAVGLLERRTVLSLCVAVVWFALAAGAKISVFPGEAIFMVIAVFMMRRELFTRKAVASIAITLVPVAILLSRYIANLVMFGHPFLRVGVEKAEPSIDTLIQNVTTIGERFIGFFPNPPVGGAMLSVSLAAGLGIAGWLSVAGLLSGRLRPSGSQVTLVMLSILSIGITAYIIPARMWGFRYFLPFVSVIAIAGLVAFMDSLTNLRMPARSLAGAGLLVAAAFDFGICFIEGDLSGPDSFKFALARSITESPQQQTMLNFPGLVAELAPLNLDLDSANPKTLAVMNQINSPILIFQGPDAQNRLYFAKDWDTLVATTMQRHPDYVVVAKSDGGKVRPSGMPGYRWISDSANYDIARRIR